MGFDGIASQAIMFIAVLGASAMLIIAFDDQLTGASQAIDTQQDSLQYQIKTSINIETVSYNSTSNTVTFYARNTGATTLRLDKLGVYLNDMRISNSTSERNISIQADTTLGTSTNANLWDPSEVIQGNITVSTTQASLYSGTTNTLRIVTQYVSEDEYEFIPT